VGTIAPKLPDDFFTESIKEEILKEKLKTVARSLGIKELTISVADVHATTKLRDKADEQGGVISRSEISREVDEEVENLIDLISEYEKDASVGGTERQKELLKAVMEELIVARLKTRGYEVIDDE